MNVDHILDALNHAGVEYLLIGGMNFGLADADMLACQEALPPAARKTERIAFFRKHLGMPP